MERLKIKDEPNDSDEVLAVVCRLKNKEYILDGYLCYNNGESVDDVSDEKKKKKISKLFKNKKLLKTFTKDQIDELYENLQEDDNSSDSEDEYLITPGHEHISKELVLPRGLYFKPVHRPVDGEFRECFYINGRAGAGKSYWCSDFLKDYINQYPDNKIYIFSGVDEDEAFDKFEKVERVNLLDLTLAEGLPPITKYLNSCCIFDDVNELPIKEMREKVLTLRDLILQNGRHKGITCLCTSHVALDGPKSKLPISTSHGVVIFPRGNQEQFINLSAKKCKYNQKLIDYIIKKYGKSRWFNFYKDGSPPHIIHEKGCLLLK